ncbi:MAG TPA: isopentenyl transferase family protein, partial [Ginsengibacter sp.]|nr:isopentenyl transferase family protein [Ginsengibacter sp.]
MSDKKTAIIICGPTAVGKTDYAFRLAEKYHTQILSADSRQCYRELDIGVAK